MRRSYLRVEEGFEQAGVLHLTFDIWPPQFESRSGGVHLQVALLTESRQEAGSKPAAAATAHKQQYGQCAEVRSWAAILLGAKWVTASLAVNDVFE